MRLTLAACIFAGLLSGQTFEVASVKPAMPGPNGPRSRIVRGGPGSTDPGTVMMTNIDLASLMTLAYGINSFQLEAPGWLGDARFDITAKVPPDTTVEQYRRMLQNLLADRFKLALHRDRKEGQVFDLVVDKNGAKLKESTPGPSVTTDGSLQPPPGPPHPPPGFAGPVGMAFGRTSIDVFCTRLSAVVAAPVQNATGLNGLYEIRLNYSFGGPRPDAAETGGLPESIFDALTQQLGLKLVPKKGMIDHLVVEHIEKAPTEN